MNYPFEEFHEITRMQQGVTITEKVHGTNAQILVETVYGRTESGGVEAVGHDVLAGSRTRWLTPDDDNYGFARWVEDRKEALTRLLGPGRHYGEYFGSGINSGYGLSKGEKRLALFNTHRWTAENTASVPGLSVVPTLYAGPWRPGVVEEAMARLKAEGSSIAPGFMKPEGVVIRFDRSGATFKQVFEAEESGWAGKPNRERAPDPGVDQATVHALYQPVRLEKLLSRDERHLREYPRSLPDIVKAYVADMEKEGQFEGVDEAVEKAARKGLFAWVKGWMKEKGYSA